MYWVMMLASSSVIVDGKHIFVSFDVVEQLHIVNINYFLPYRFLKKFKP